MILIRTMVPAQKLADYCNFAGQSVVQTKNGVWINDSWHHGKGVQVPCPSVLAKANNESAPFDEMNTYEASAKLRKLFIDSQIKLLTDINGYDHKPCFPTKLQRGTTMISPFTANTINTAISTMPYAGIVSAYPGAKLKNKPNQYAVYFTVDKSKVKGNTGFIWAQKLDGSTHEYMPCAHFYFDLMQLLFGVIADAKIKLYGKTWTKNKLELAGVSSVAWYAPSATKKLNRSIIGYTKAHAPRGTKFTNPVLCGKLEGDPDKKAWDFKGYSSTVKFDKIGNIFNKKPSSDKGVMDPMIGRIKSEHRSVISDVYAFYLLEEMSLSAPNFRKEAQDAYIADLAKSMFDYIVLICWGEVRHAGTLKMPPGFYDGIKEGMGGRSKIATAALKYDPFDALPKMAEIFENKHCFHGGGYGGPLWARIARLGMDYRNYSPRVWLDHVVNISHNGGLAFNKGFVFSQPSESEYIELLNWRREKDVSTYTQAPRLGNLPEFLYIIGVLDVPPKQREYPHITWGNKVWEYSVVPKDEEVEVEPDEDENNDDGETESASEPVYGDVKL